MQINNLIIGLKQIERTLGDIEVQVITDDNFNKIDLINSNSVKILKSKTWFGAKILEFYFDPKSDEQFFTIKLLINGLQKIMESHCNIDISRMQIRHYPDQYLHLYANSFFVHTLISKTTNEIQLKISNNIEV